MNLELTDQQVEELIACVYLANWMVNGVRLASEHVDRFDAFEQYVYARAYQEGFTSLIECDQEKNEFLPAQTFEEGETNELRENYNEEIFWAELMERLAIRDCVLMYGEERWAAMDEKEQRKVRSDILRIYAAEFEKNGVERLSIQKGS